MAIRANRHQVLNRVYFVFISNRANGNDVVYVNEILPNGPIGLLEIEATDCTVQSMMLNASLSGFCTAFKRID